jgi:hypothetical protein
MLPPHGRAARRRGRERTVPHADEIVDDTQRSSSPLGGHFSQRGHAHVRATYGRRTRNVLPCPSARAAVEPRPWRATTSPARHPVGSPCATGERNSLYEPCARLTRATACLQLAGPCSDPSPEWCGHARCRARLSGPWREEVGIVVIPSSWRAARFSQLDPFRASSCATSFFVATCTKASRTSRWTRFHGGFVSSTTPTQPFGPT